MKTLLFCFLFFIVSGANAQTEKAKSFRAIQFSWVKKDNVMVYDDYIPCNILIVCNYQKQQVKIMDRDLDEFNIISTDDTFENQGGGISLLMHCLDKDGVSCNILIWTLLRNGTKKMLLGVKYADQEYSYVIEPI